MTSRIIIAWGATSMGKSTFAINGSGKTWYAEFDPGSYDRATEAIDPSELTRITLAKFYAPLTSIIDAGTLSTAMMGQSGKGAVQIGHKLKGWREKYNEFWQGYVQACEADYDTIVIDTSSRLWNMAQNALRQRIQEEVQGVDQAERLKRLEYQEPNDQLTMMVNAAKETGKNLVLIAHEGEKWVKGEPTGEAKPDGWGDAAKESDISLRFTIKNRLPVATVYKPEVLVKGWEIENPTMQKADEFLRALALNQKLGFPAPESYQGLMEAVKGL